MFPSLKPAPMPGPSTGPQPASSPATTECYVWTYSSCPFRILLNFNVIDQIRADVDTAGAREIGGILIGKKRSPPGILHICDFIPLSVQPKSTNTHFKFSSEWMAEVIARCPSDCKIVGYYRTDLEQHVQLRVEDQQLVQQWFKGLDKVVLVIASTESAKATAGFFFWENGSITLNPGLTFPFSTNELVWGGWPKQSVKDGPVRNKRFGSISTYISELLVRAGVPTNAALPFLAVVVLTIAIVTGTLLMMLTAPTNSGAVQRLGLQVSPKGTNYALSWNTSAPEVVAAKGATLEIREGNAAPFLIPLTAGQLRHGSISYGAFPVSHIVQFRLETVDDAGKPLISSVASISPPADALAAVEARTPQASDTADFSPKTRRAVRTLVTNNSKRPIATWQLPGDSSAGGSAEPLLITVKELNGPSKNRTAILVPTEADTKTALSQPVVPDPPQIPAATNLQNPLSMFFLPPKTPSAPSGNIAQNTNPRPALRGIASDVGFVTITSEPGEAMVSIDSNPAGVTPVTLQFSPLGIGFTVTVHKSGYTSWTVQTVATAQPYALHAQLKQLTK